MTPTVWSRPRAGTTVGMRPIVVAVAGMLVLGLAALGPTAQARSAQPGARALTGALEGSAELEGGCAWLARPEGRYEVWWPEGHHVEHAPLRLVGPAGEVVATEGEQVSVRGVLVPEAATVCQVGSVFDAQSLVTGHR